MQRNKVVVTGLLLLAAALLLWMFLPALLVLPLLLLLPGWLLSMAFFPAGVGDLAVRLLFAIAFSIALLIFGGLLLNWLPGGIALPGAAIVMGVLTLLAAGVAYRRGAEVAPSAWVERIAWPFSRMESVLLVAAVLVTIASVAAARQPAPAQEGDGYTVLWMEPDAKREGTIQLGIHNKELRFQTYRLELRREGQEVQHAWPAIQLGHEESWRQQVRLPAGSANAAAGPVRFEALLYRAEAPDVVYRRAALWSSSLWPEKEEE